MTSIFIGMDEALRPEDNFHKRFTDRSPSLSAAFSHIASQFCLFTSEQYVITAVIHKAIYHLGFSLWISCLYHRQISHSPGTHGFLVLPLFHLHVLMETSTIRTLT